MSEKKMIESFPNTIDVLESSYDGIAIVDSDALIIYANEAYENITGIKRSRVVGRNMKELFNEGFCCKPNIIFTILDTKKTFSTMLYNHKRGNEVLLTGKPIFDADGNITKIIINVRDISQLNQMSNELERAQKLNEFYEGELKNIFANNSIVASSDSMKKIVNLAIRLAKVDSTVLILGESGTGKDVIARLIHEISERKNKPFVRVNCGAIPDNLLESEMFGYEKGAFSGANITGKPGLLEAAHEGTVFLDEIGEMPLSLQPKVLMAIQEQEITRLGSIKPIKINVRIIAATNRDLLQMVKTNQFREDLYYRLNVVPLSIAPLRERREDIVPLIEYYQKVLNEKYNQQKLISKDTLNVLVGYSWPGNVRELKNILERLYIMSDGRELDLAVLPEGLLAPSKIASGETSLEQGNSLNSAVDTVEKDLIEKALLQYKSIRKASSVLGISHPTLIRKIRKYGINGKD